MSKQIINKWAYDFHKIALQYLNGRTELKKTLLGPTILNFGGKPPKQRYYWKNFWPKNVFKGYNNIKF